MRFGASLSLGGEAGGVKAAGLLWPSFFCAAALVPAGVFGLVGAGAKRAGAAKPRDVECAGRAELPGLAVLFTCVPLLLKAGAGLGLLAGALTSGAGGVSTGPLPGDLESLTGTGTGGGAETAGGRLTPVGEAIFGALGASGNSAGAVEIGAGLFGPGKDVGKGLLGDGNNADGLRTNLDDRANQIPPPKSSKRAETKMIGHSRRPWAGSVSERAWRPPLTKCPLTCTE